MPGDKPGQQKVIVELNGDAPVGRFNDHIMIHTTSPRQPVITVPVFGRFWLSAGRIAARATLARRVGAR